MLQRIYGASFLSQKELDEHLARLEEGKARDHRKLGRELDLYTFHPLAPASPFFQPKGAAVYTALLDYLRAEYRLRGYDEVVTRRSSTRSSSGSRATTTTIARTCTSGIDEREFGVKPMNCPGHHPHVPGEALVVPGSARAVRGLRRLHRYERSGSRPG